MYQSPWKYQNPYSYLQVLLAREGFCRVSSQVKLQDTNDMPQYTHAHQLRIEELKVAERVAKMAQVGPIWGREEMKSEMQSIRNLYKLQTLKQHLQNKVRNAIK